MGLLWRIRVMEKIPVCVGRPHLCAVVGLGSFTANTRVCLCVPPAGILLCAGCVCVLAVRCLGLVTGLGVCTWLGVYVLLTGMYSSRYVRLAWVCMSG